MSPPLPLRAGRLAGALAVVALLAPAAASASTYSDEVLSRQPLHYWRMGDANTVTGALDLGTPFRFPNWKSWKPAWRGDGVRFGEPGALAGDGDTAARFDGATTRSGATPPLFHYYDLPYLGQTQMSWEAWIKPGKTDATSRRIMASEDARGGVLLAARGGDVVFSRYVNPGSYRMWSHKQLDGGPSGGDIADFTQTVWHTLSAPLQQGRWNHVVANYALTVMPYPPKGTMKLYVNGKLAASRRSELVPVLPNQYVPLRIGSNNGGWLRYDGWLDDVAVYWSYMSHSLVPVHYKLGLTGSAR